MTRRIRGVALALAASLALGAGMNVPAAQAQLSPQVYNPATDRPPANEDPKPPVEMEQRTKCASSAVLPDSQFHSIPANVAFRVSDLHEYADGTGQTVAVIDSGVSPNSRLPRLRGAGDYVAGGDGLSDCDHHGTLVAGIIGASAARDDSFTGVAPGVSLVSIRQTSQAYAPRNRSDEGVSSSNLVSLSRAIVRAADEGATVINMSVTACVPSNAQVDLRELRGALHYAAVDKNVVVVASAGNTDGSCETNPGPDPADPLDPRGWSTATTMSLPSYIDEFVLSVGGVDLYGNPYSRTLPGPWVDVAAPAVDIVSLDPAAGDMGGLINAEVTQEGVSAISGTSFAAAYVSGLAALIRQRHPELNAEQVRNRIINSSQVAAGDLNNVVGYGVVDPVRALVGDVDTASPVSPEFPSRLATYRTPEDDPNRFTAAFAAVLVLLLAAAALVVAVRSWFVRGRDDASTDDERVISLD